jgi:carbon storage regulator CsrA
MLVFSRERDEVVQIGTPQTATVELTLADVLRLRQCTDPQLLNIAQRLLAAIGASIARVTVVDIHGHKVRLGIEAPRNIEVNRLEVVQAIARDGRRGRAA